jgi:very-short-patch-repair endonuclease
MIYYNKKLKSNARQLRKNLTQAETLLWSRLRRKQMLNIQFYRQKPIGNYIVDFYAPSIRLVIEADGSQHNGMLYMQRDRARDLAIESKKLKVLRFDNLQILKSIDSVMSVIFSWIELRI